MEISQTTEMTTRFVKRIRQVDDTPSLIRLIAADAVYLMICREIVSEGLHRSQKFVGSVKSACVKQGFEFQSLQDKLLPVARALGLNLSRIYQIDYYSLLGVDAQADISEIKKAYRKMVYDVHPDTSSEKRHDHEKFIELNDAYRTLCDPALRAHYDLSRQNLFRWYEAPIQIAGTDRKPASRFVWQLATLVIVLVIGIFVFDFLVP